MLAALANFILLAVLLITLKVYLFSSRPIVKPRGNVFYTADHDPLITKAPSLKDMLRGPIINGPDSARGSDKAKIIIVEFSDFECEFCHQQEEVLAKILEKYRDEVKLIWKDYPSSDSDSGSFQAAVAGRCADELGKFWEYHDLLYQSQDFSQDGLIFLAKALGLRESKFKECLEDEEIKNLVYDNIKEAQALGINGVPFVYVGKQEILGEVSYEELEKMVLSGLK